MANKIANFLITLAVIGFIAVWGLYFRSSKTHEFVINDKPLISVNYFSKSNTLEESVREKADKLRLVSQVFSLSNPNEKQAEIGVGDYFKFADYNVISVGNREQFLATANIKNMSNDHDNFISEILEDKNNQKFASLYPNQSYKVYVQFKDDSSSQPRGIVINKVTYPISKIDNDFYLVDNFLSTDNPSVGLKTDNECYNVQEAFFVTNKINPKQLLSRTVSSIKPKLDRRGSLLEIKIPGKSFIFLSTDPGTYLKNRSPSNSQPDLINVNDYDHKFVDTAPRINLAETKTLNLVSESATYDIKNTADDKRLLFNIILSIILIIIIAGLHYRKLIISVFDRFAVKKNLWNSKLKKFLQNRGVELAIFGAVMLLLLILRANPVGEQLFSATNLLVILFVFLLILLRFTLRYLMLVLLSLIGIVAILEQFDYLVIGEKAGKLLFLLILIIVISIIFSRGKSIVKKHYGKQKKS